MLKNIGLFLAIFILGACVVSVDQWPPEHALESLSSKSYVDDNTVIVLIGVKGSEHVNYLSFGGGVKPPGEGVNSVYQFKVDAMKNDVLAFPIEVSKEKVYLYVYTTQEDPPKYAGYPYGFRRGPEKPMIDVSRPGIYYYATIDTDVAVETRKYNEVGFNFNPDPAFLAKARAKYGHLLQGKQPVNFVWP